MLSPRNVIILAAVVVALSLATILINLSLPPDSNGLGRDSYGTRAGGHRALYEILQETGVPVKRGLIPPNAFLKRPVALALISPAPELVDSSRNYMQAVATWVRGGGLVIVAPANTGKRSPLPRPRLSDGREVGVLEALGLAKVRCRPAEELAERSDKKEATGKAAKQRKRDQDQNPDQQKEFSFKNLFKKTETRRLAVASDGEWAALSKPVRWLETPAEGLQALDPATLAKATDRLYAVKDEKTSYPLAASFTVGRGRVVVISDPFLLSNQVIAKADNAVLAVHLFAIPAAPVVFDEFFHGLTVQGNPFWLLARFPYCLLLGVLIALAALWAWREAVPLGDPLPERLARHRNIAEYVEAIANLFDHRRHHRFVLRELSDGALWLLARRLALKPGPESLEPILRTLERRDPARAAQLREGMAMIERLLGGSKDFSHTEMLKAVRKVLACL